MSSFDFFLAVGNKVFNEVYKNALLAEEGYYYDVHNTQVKLGTLLEQFIKYICEREGLVFEGVYDSITMLSYEKYLPYNITEKAKQINGVNNKAKHAMRYDQSTALESLCNFYDFSKWYVIKYWKNDIAEYAQGRYVLPTKDEVDARSGRKNSDAEIEKITKEYEQKIAEYKVKEEKLVSNVKNLEAKAIAAEDAKSQAEKDAAINKKRVQDLELKATVARENAEKIINENIRRANEAETRAYDAEEKAKLAEACAKAEAQKRCAIEQELAPYKVIETANRKIASESEILNNANLNAAQQNAVVSTEGYVKVVAGPGTGKTNTLSYRYAHILTTKDVGTDNILCVTFTNKAANEMKNRIAALVGENDFSQVCTFHAFYHSILSKNAELLNFPATFTVLDDEDTDIIINDILEEHNISPEDTTPKTVKDKIKGIKKNRPIACMTCLFGEDENIILDCIADSKNVVDSMAYEFILEQRKLAALQFDDMLNAVRYLFKHHPEIGENLKKRLKYIMVDEFQDVDDEQYRFIKFLSEENGNLFVVGDPNQTIYEWRGANIRYIRDFENNFENVKVINLIENYRSASPIVDTAEQLISNNGEVVHQHSNLTGKIEPVFYHAENRAAEASWCLSEIKKLVESGENLSDCAVLYRNERISFELRECLRTNGIPFVVFGGKPFYKRQEIKVIVSYLQMAVRDDDSAFKRTISNPGRGIGKKRISILDGYMKESGCSYYEALKANMNSEDFNGTYATEYVNLIESIREMNEKKTVSSIIIKIVEDTAFVNYQLRSGKVDAVDNICELIKLALEFDESYMSVYGKMPAVEDYLMHIATFTVLDRRTNEDRLVLSTIHAAKGEEYNNVFVCGLEESNLPMLNQNDSKCYKERRLCYVAVTRAKKRLFLSDACITNVRNKETKMETSRFVKEMIG